MSKRVFFDCFLASVQLRFWTAAASDSAAQLNPADIGPNMDICMWSMTSSRLTSAYGGSVFSWGGTCETLPAQYAALQVPGSQITQKVQLIIGIRYSVFFIIYAKSNVAVIMSSNFRPN